MQQSEHVYQLFLERQKLEARLEAIKKELDALIPGVRKKGGGELNSPDSPLRTISKTPRGSALQATLDAIRRFLEENPSKPYFTSNDIIPFMGDSFHEGTLRSTLSRLADHTNGPIERGDARGLYRKRP